MKKIICNVLVVTGFVLIYFLLEPIILHTYGWKSFPNTRGLHPIVNHQDSISKKADSILKKMYRNLKTPALSVAIGMDGNVIWSNAIGYSDIKNSKEVSLDTKFRIGSTSKAVTSMGIGVLLQNEKLNFDSRVKEFVPYITENLSEITLKQLGSHTSGIRNYGLCFCFPIWEYLNNDEYVSIQQSVNIFDNSKLLFAPGSGFSYSTYNYTLLSAMIEGVSDKDFLSFMKESVFDPLELNHIYGESSLRSIENTSRFYEIENGEYKEVYPVNNSNKWAGGGFIATPTDLVKLGNAFLNHTLFSKKVTQSLAEPVLLNNGELNNQNYAVGWRNGLTEGVFDKHHKVKILHHAGTAAGSTSLLILFPEYNVSISLLINKSDSVSELFTYSFKLANLFITQNT